jgi:uncharacterized membrane protein YsdA (DUF1294 family)
MARRMTAQTFHGVVALAASAVLAALVFLLLRLSHTWYNALAAWLAAVNVVAFGYYGYDKARARLGSGRVPEVVLHGLVFAGGTLGAYAGMRYFRHKTIKASFRFLFWFLVVVQVALIAVVLFRWWKDRG